VLDMARASLKSWLGRNYDVHPDGIRFVGLAFPAHLADQGNVILVENWAAEFSARQPWPVDRRVMGAPAGRS
jgi:hypothetical protein